MTDLRWRTDAPTIPGWYWWRLKPGSMCSKIYRLEQWLGGGLCVYEPDVADYHDGWTIPAKLGGEWLGPLLAPA